MRAADSPPRSPARLPPHERLCTRPSPRGCSTLPVRVDYPKLDFVHEPFNLVRVFAEDTSCQAILRVVDLLECLVQRLELSDDDEGEEELFPEEPVLRGEAGDVGGLDVESLSEDSLIQRLAATEDFSPPPLYLPYRAPEL